MFCIGCDRNGCDLAISNDCNINNSSFSHLGSCYELPNGLTYASDESKSYLAGSHNFSVSEFEVFILIWH